jgi:hypothetical protein
MPYEVRLKAPAEREAVIAKGVKSPSDTLPFNDFRGKPTRLPVIRVDIALPIYRMANFRTYSHQQSEIAKKGLPADYFSAGQEVESVQQVQHEILFGLAKKGVADSVVPVIKVLEGEGQIDPLLATSGGVMVNGNRRLAALRELGHKYVDLMILPPDTTAADILDIEASLQGKPETKLDYDWIGDGQLILALRALGRTPEEIGKKLHRSPKDIANVEQAMIEADLYLKEWAGKPGQYAEITEDAEQVFKDLPARVAKKDPALAHASRVIAWTLYDNRDNLGGRLYNFNAAFGALAADVLERTATTLNIPMTKPPGAEEPEIDDLSIDLDEDQETPSYDGIVEALKSPVSREKAAQVLIESSITALEVAKGQKDSTAALKAVTEANTKLLSVDLSRAARNSYEAIGKQLQSIEDRVKKLREQLAEME